MELSGVMWAGGGGRGVKGVEGGETRRKAVRVSESVESSERVRKSSNRTLIGVRERSSESTLCNRGRLSAAKSQSVK